MADLNLIVPGRATTVTAPPSGLERSMLVLKRAMVDLREAKTKDNFDKFKDSFLRAMKAAEYNFVYFAPLFYPKYLPSKLGGATPLDFSRRPFAKEFLSWNVGGTTVVRGSRQISKTTLIAAGTDMTSTLLPGYKTLIVAPRTDQIKTIADKCKELADINVFNRRKVKGSKLRQNVYYREYRNGSAYKLNYALTSASNIRGTSAASLRVDEGQDFDSSLEPELIEVIKRHPMSSYAVTGTALGTDSFLETKYLESAQGTWVTKCEACGTDNDAGEIDHALKMVRPQGLCCRKCSARINPERGKMIYRFPERLEMGLQGIHIPQIIIPDIANNVKEWNAIYSGLNGANVGKAIQEALGIPVTSGDRELTKEDLENMCVLRRDNWRPSVRKEWLSQYQMVMSGCDWGGSDYNPSLRTKKSNTAHVIIGVRHDGLWDILHMAVYTGMEYPRIAAAILRDHRAFGGTHMASDHGVGMFYNTAMRASNMIAISRHYLIQYNGQATKIIAPMRTAGQLKNAFVAHRTESLSALFNKIKSKRMRCYEYDKAKPQLDEILSIYRAPQESSSGVNRFVYHKAGNKCDDVAQALNFAQIGIHIATGEELVPEGELVEQLLQEQNIAQDIEQNMQEMLEDHEEQQGWHGHQPFGDWNG